MASKSERLTNRISDIVIWTLISGAALALGCGVVSVLGAAVGYAIAFSPAFILFAILMLLLAGSGPISILIVGLRRYRMPMIVGPLLLIPIISAYSIASNWVDFDHRSTAVAELDQREFASAAKPHGLIFMEFARSPDCDAICRQILLRTNYSVGIDGAPRVLYRKVSQSECATTDLTTLHFSGACVTREVSTQAIDDGLLIETPVTSVPGGQSEWEWRVLSELSGPEFSGDAFALVERIPGSEDRPLGRWVSGEVAVWPFHSGQIGKRFSRSEFYAAALGVPVQE